MTPCVWIIEQREKRKGAKWHDAGLSFRTSQREVEYVMQSLCVALNHEYRAVRYVRDDAKGER
jgi:hypothetical protein